MLTKLFHLGLIICFQTCLFGVPFLLLSLLACLCLPLQRLQTGKKICRFGEQINLILESKGILCDEYINCDRILITEKFLISGSCCFHEPLPIGQVLGKTVSDGVRHGVELMID
jgi:hypothetical protein